MPVYRRETRIDAPLEVVWDFYTSVRGLEQLTPQFMGLRVESVEEPDGEPGADELLPGTRIRLSMRPFGLGPRQSWVSVVTDREGRDGSAYFRDRMEQGPFPKWVHTHRFSEDGGRRRGDQAESRRGDGTLVVDRVEYRLPGGLLGRVAEPFGDLGFEPMFRYRHRKTKELLEESHRRVDPRT